MTRGSRGGRGKRRACKPDGAYTPLEYATIRTLYMADPIYWVGVMERAAVDAPALLTLAGSSRAVPPCGNAIARRAMQEIWDLPWEASFRQLSGAQGVDDASLEPVARAVDPQGVIITVGGCGGVFADWAHMLCWFEGGVRVLLDPSARLGQMIDETNVVRREKLQARLRSLAAVFEAPPALRDRVDLDRWSAGLRARRAASPQVGGHAAFDVLDFLRSILTRLVKNGMAVRSCLPFRCGACKGLYLVHCDWKRTKTCSRECDEVLQYQKAEKS